METEEYEKKILHQMLFTGEGDERVFGVLLSYLSKTENDEMAVDMLDFYSEDYFLEKEKAPESYKTILAQQVAKKSPLSMMTRLSYLSQKAENPPEEEEKENIVLFLADLCRKNIVFPFFEAFDSFYEIPSMLREMTFFTWKNPKKDREVLTLTVTDGQGRSRLETVMMESVSPGYAFGSAYLLKDEKFSIQIGEMAPEQKETPKEREENLETFTLSKEVKNSRRNLLYRMEQEKGKAGRMRAEYEQVLARMEEELVILYER
jgi:hypothetical protein